MGVGKYLIYFEQCSAFLRSKWLSTVLVVIHHVFQLFFSMIVDVTSWIKQSFPTHKYRSIHQGLTEIAIYNTQSPIDVNV